MADVRIVESEAELFERAAAFVRDHAQKAVDDKRACSVALSGGSTPRQLFELLVSEPWRSTMPWRQMHVFWGDERCVPPDHQDSNYRMARQAMLDHVSIPPVQVHRMAGEHADPAAAAAEYEGDLKSYFDAHGAAPRFDLVLLGMGDDGHTASLFPGTFALAVNDRWVTHNYVEKLSTYRITFTYTLLNAAAAVLFMTAGQNKATALREVLEGESAPLIFPSQGVKPVNGTLTWLIDRAAAQQLSHGPAA